MAMAFSDTASVSPEDAERLRYRTIRSAAALVGIDPGEGLGPTITATEMRILVESKIDSIACLLLDPNSTLQGLYDATWQAQCVHIQSFLDEARSRGLHVLPVQGIEKDKRYLGGHALNRRDDLDFLVRADQAEAVANVLVDQGFRQAELAAAGGLGKALTSEQMRQLLEDSKMGYVRGYPFLKSVPFDADPLLLRHLPRVMRPLRRTDTGVELIIMIDLMTAYGEDMPTNILWTDLRPSGFDGADTPSAEVDLLFTAYRLCRKLEVKSVQTPWTRLLAELVLVIAAEDDLDWDLVAIMAQSCGMDPVVDSCIATAAAMVSPIHGERARRALRTRPADMAGDIDATLKTLFPLGTISSIAR